MNSGLWVSASAQRHAEGVWSKDIPAAACCAGERCKSARGWKGSEQRDQEFTHLLFSIQDPQLM